MEMLESSLGKIELSNYEVGTEHFVLIINTVSPHNFHVRLTKHVPFIERLEKLAPSAQPLYLNENDIVIFNMNRSPENPKYVRGKIAHIKKYGSAIKYDLFALDYGHLCRKMPREYIWECPANLVEIPPLALHCRLGNCEVLRGRFWDEDSVNAFRYYVAMEKAKMTILEKESEKLIVQLKNTNPYDIATLMAMTGHSVLRYDPNATSRMPVAAPQKRSLKYKSININDTLHVRVQSGKSLDAFYVAEVNDYQEFLKEYDKITYNAKKESNLATEKFEANELVCVKNELSEKYERAIIKEVIVPKTKAIVKLVDWGIEERANILNMRAMSEQCMQIPVLAIYCSTEKSQVADSGLSQLLNPGFEFLIHVKLVGKEFESPNIVDISPLSSQERST